MSPQLQEDIGKVAERFGTGECIVVVGISDCELCEVYAQTVTQGDPSEVGALSGVSLGLPVYHFFDPEIKRFCDAAIWKERFDAAESDPETSGDVTECVCVVAGIRRQYSLFDF